jgi:multidrug efflux pump subunit AcrB
MAAGERLGVSGGLAKAFLTSQLTPLLGLVLLLLGLFAVAVTPKEEEPQINVTMANVLIAFPGASSADVHNLVTVPAEQVLSQLTGIEHIYSTTQPGQAILTVQFKVGESRIESLVKLYDVLMSNRDWLPTNLGVLEPIVKPKGIDDVPIVTLTLHSARDEKSASDLQKVARALEVEIKRVPGTREVTALGGPDEVVGVVLDPVRMNAHQITALDVERALRAANASTVSGELVSGNRTVDVRTGQFLNSARDVADVIVGVRERRPVALADVADVNDGADRPSRYVWHGQRASDAGADFVNARRSRCRSRKSPVPTLRRSRSPSSSGWSHCAANWCPMRSRSALRATTARPPATRRTS